MPSTPLGENQMTTNTFNIAMIDVSGSMSSYWSDLENSWNQFVAPKLSGKTRIFCFDTKVRFKRTGTNLESSDFTSGSTELTGALQTIVSQVYECPQKYVNVIIITDGEHNSSSIQPDHVINQMQAPRNKICSVYLLGIGSSFPVKYSIDIRSRLHSGSSNLPPLYWAKLTNDIKEQMEDISNNLSSGVSLSMKLSVSGLSLPGLTPKRTFYLNEYVYLENEPANYKTLMVEDRGSVGQLSLEPKEIEVAELFDVLRQWNSVIIQLKSNKESIPEDIIPFMERIFEAETKKMSNTEGPKSISDRLAKTEKTHDMEFRTLVNKIKTILTQEKFSNELELAETILSSAVTKSKYETKALQLKGHTDKEYEGDCEAFLKVYDENKEVVRKLKDQPQDKCQATQQSTLSDLQDDALPQLMKRNKFEFLKEFTISGIPVFAPTRDSVSLNPWSYRVQRILDAPYTIMSQVAMETMAKNSVDDKNKTVQAKDDDDSTKFNAIVPVFPSNIAKDLRPIVRTRLYAMCATFAILKNPHMIDFNVHMAALGVTWVRFLFDYPEIPRPEHVRIRMESIEATATCYMDRPGFANYVRLLLANPQEALMTESNKEVEGRTMKCETIIKPMFILNMIQLGDLKVDSLKLVKLIEVMVLEYIGRCLSHYKKGDNEEESTPFTDFFADSLTDQEKKKQIMEKYVQDAKAKMSQASENLLESFYTYDEVSSAARKVAKTKVEEMKGKMAAEIPAKVNMEKVLQLRNVTSAGDVSLNTLQTFARHVGLGEGEIKEIFGEEHMFVCTAHGLQHRASRERLEEVVHSYEECKKTVTKKVQEENLKAITKSLYKSLVEALQNEWLTEYRKVHTEVVEPMSRQQIIYQAQAKGIEVTEETFDSVYKRYRPHVGLLGNACQTKVCPYYLQPNKKFNNHMSVERKMGEIPFVHGLHLTISQNCEQDLSAIISKLSSGAETKEKKSVPEEDVNRWESGIKSLKNIYKEIRDGKRENP